jgi:hypothetical protein
MLLAASVQFKCFAAVTRMSGLQSNSERSVSRSAVRLTLLLYKRRTLVMHIL